MGFRSGTFAKVWEVEPMGDTKTKLRISTSFKNKQTDQYEQDYSGYVICYGTAVARQAAALQERTVQQTPLPGSLAGEQRFQHHRQHHRNPRGQLHQHSPGMQ